MAKLCACGCGKLTRKNGMYIRGHNRFGKGKQKSPPQICQCGCGGMTTAGHIFIHGHNNARVGTGKPKTPPQLCQCGCGLMTNEGRRYIKSHCKPHEGCKATEEQLKKFSDITKEIWQRESFREKHHQSMLAAWDNKEIRIRHSKIQKIAQNRPESRESNSKKITLLWRDEDYVKKQYEARALRPNGPETVVLNLLHELYPSQYRYSGDFSFIINGKNPDFININGQKKCIELFGDYWHRGENPQKRKSVFAKDGWSTLVIWEHELKNIERVKSKICRFHRKEKTL